MDFNLRYKFIYLFFFLRNNFNYFTLNLIIPSTSNTIKERVNKFAFMY